MSDMEAQPAQVDNSSSRSREEEKYMLRPFPILEHMRSRRPDQPLRTHLKIGAQNLLGSLLMIGAIKTAERAPKRWKPRRSQIRTIEKELHSYTEKDQFVRILMSMPVTAGPDLGKVEWKNALKKYAVLDYPNYYLQPFHSMPGGWLSPTSAGGDRKALNAIYAHAHPKKSLGLRKHMATLFPEDAKLIYDLGAGSGDQAGAILRRLPEAEIVCVDASPFMIEIGKRQNPDKNIRWVHSMAEDIDAADGSVDAVNISIVFHELPNFAKRKLLQTAFRILKPGGKLVLSDIPPNDLESYRGFYEPYAQEWLSYDPGADMHEVGFRDVQQHVFVNAQWMWSRTGIKPAS